MSSVYATEPATNGKVVFHTNLGDIDIELWSKECPKTCRNFLQLIMEGYYDKLIIHRIIPNLLIQTGDPQGTGQTRTEDIYNGTFDYTKEIHSRIKFNHRGQVAMAESHGSQFFITLDKADWLGTGNSSGTGINRQYCIFGKVTGPSIYNLVRISELTTDKHDRPLDPPYINSVEILSNPFDDIIIRPNSKRALMQIANTNNSTNNNNSLRNNNIQPKKQASHLLSFGDDEDEGTTIIPNKSKEKSISSSNLPAKKSLVGNHVVDNISQDNPLSTVTINSSSSSSHSSIPHTNTISSQPSTTTVPKPINTSLNVPQTKINEQIDEESKIELERQKRAEEFLKLTDELRHTRKAINVVTGAALKQQEEDIAKTTLLTPLQAMREKYTQKKRNIGNREAETLAKLAVFQNTLKSVVSETTTASNTGNTDANTSSTTKETYHGQILENTETVNVQDTSWMGNRLKFKHHIDDSYKGFTNNLIGKTNVTNSESLDNDDGGLITIDPRQSNKTDNHHGDNHRHKRRRDSEDN